MKLNQTKVQVIARDDPDALTIAVNDWLKNSGEATLISMHYSSANDLRQSDSEQFPVYSAMIVYTN